MELNIPLLLYAVVQIVAFFCVLVGTLIVIFRISDPERIVNGYITLWGTTLTVGNSSVYSSSKVIWQMCPGRLMCFRIAQTLAILSILVYGAAFVLGVIMLFCCTLLRWICLTLNIVGAITLGIVWAAMVFTYFTDEGRLCQSLKSFAGYGAGFALLVAAWVLDILNIVFLLLPFHITVFRELDGSNENSDGKSKERSTERSSQEEEDEEYE
uniref:Putative amastin-like protein n=1 Tax=Leishmania guyanensis TaxID=5670 RepID=A0A1E1J9I1_LEIGU|nr:Putative amastin-like protein [Leishmania guyanensis]